MRKLSTNDIRMCSELLERGRRDKKASRVSFPTPKEWTRLRGVHALVRHTWIVIAAAKVSSIPTTTVREVAHISTGKAALSATASNLYINDQRALGRKTRNGGPFLNASLAG